MINKSQDWVPHTDFKSNHAEINDVLLYTDQWCKNEFHQYIKTVESHLLSSFRDMMNKCYNKQREYPKPDWILTTQEKWRSLALFRDFHDYMCGRDHKHYIRTDDCRRFVLGITRGLKSNNFIKPVHRLLNGESAPRAFTHPAFVVFN